MVIFMSDDGKCKDCAYFVNVYDGFCDLKKLRVNPVICRCDYWTKERIPNLEGVRR